MNRVRIGLVALLLALPSFVLAADDPFAEFRIPDHSWSTSAFDLRGDLSASDASRSNEQFDGHSSRAHLSSAWNRFRDSERVRAVHALRASASHNWSESESSSRYDGFGWAGPYSAQERTGVLGDQGFASALAASEWVFSPSPTAWSPRIAARAEGAWLRRRSGSRRTWLTSDTLGGRSSLSEYSSVERSANYAAALDLGLSRGRVRDVTGVFVARLLVERMTADGRLEREPSLDAMRRLAAILHVAPGFGAVHELPDKFLWRELERVIQEDGAVSVRGFDAYDLLHAREPIVVAAGRFARSSGWQVGPLVRYEHSNRIGRESRSEVRRSTQADSVTYNFEYSRSWRSGGGDDDVQAGIQAEWHRPLGLRTQVDLVAEAVFAVGTPDERTDIASRLTLGRLIDERRFLAASASHNRNFDDEHEGRSSWATQLEISARYHLEDRWSLDLTLIQRQGRDTARLFYYYGADFQRSTTLTLGISRRSGAFNAPGLIDPVRPLN